MFLLLLGVIDGYFFAPVALPLAVGLFQVGSRVFLMLFQFQHHTPGLSSFPLCPGPGGSHFQEAVFLSAEKSS